ncbi:HNH endonuclease signature motif containing protein [Geodermatophilus sp. SYSU D00965]
MTRIGGRQSVEGLLLDWSLAVPLPDRALPVALLSREQKAAELQRVQARRARDAAYEAELVMGLADDTPDTLDPLPGTPGARSRSWAPDTELPGVSEFLAPELAVVLNCGRGTAAHLAHRAWVYRENLPGTRAALAAGELDEARAKVLADVLAHTSADIARVIEARLLPEAAGLSTGRLRNRALALLLELDADAVDARRRDAQRSADVRSSPSHLEGMATLAAGLPADEAALAALEGSAAIPGAVDGLPITAAHVRELLARIGALGLRAPEGGSLTFALTDDHGRLLATAGPDQLRRLARRGCPEHPAGDCGCPVLGRPPATGAYTPTAAQSVFIEVRDCTCRFPNCGRRVGWADLDHVVPHACGGPTDCANLCCLCRSHHRLKTFARGWHCALDDDGTLQVTTPTGDTRTTRPPGLRPPTPEPPVPPPAPPPSTESPPPDDDPPPF